MPVNATTPKNLISRLIQRVVSDAGMSRFQLALRFRKIPDRNGSSASNNKISAHGWANAMFMFFSEPAFLPRLTACKVLATHQNLSLCQAFARNRGLRLITDK